MPSYRAYFATAEEAQAAADAAIERLEATLLAEATEAGAATPTSAPTTTTTVEAVATLPSGALPSGAAEHSTVNWRVATSARHVERHISIVASDAAPQPIPASATVKITATASAKLKAKAVLPKKIQYTTTGAATAASLLGSALEDRASGKKFTITGASNTTNPGVYLADVAEDDANDIAEFTFGSQLIFTRPPENVLGNVYVAVLNGATIPNGTTFTDSATGIVYTTTAIGTLAGTEEALTGDDDVEIAFTGPTSGANAVAVGTLLDIDTPIVGVSLQAEVTESPTVTLPADSKLTRAGKSYTSSADVTIGDAGEAEVTIVADEADEDSALEVGNTLTITSPPSGVDATATVTEQSLFLPFPQPFAKQVLGPAIEWRSRVRRELDGRFRAEVFTYPPGT